MSDQQDIIWGDDKFDRSILEKKFWEYHNKNPAVWNLFQEYSFKMMGKGMRHYGARTVCEMIRWHHDINSDRDAAEFKISNNHVPFYARLFMKRHPKHKGFFRTQIRRHETDWSDDDQSS